MIYLSRLVLNPRGYEVRRDLADCQQLHRSMMRAFPSIDGNDGTARDRFGVLFRLESSPRAGGPPTVLVQSDVVPDWSSLPTGYYLESADGSPNPACRPVEATYRALSNGARLRFRLRANVTRKVETRSSRDGERRNGRRLPLGSDDERLLWLGRKGASGGFRVLAARGHADVADARTGELETTTGWRVAQHEGGPATKHLLTLAGVRFDGHLEVTDAALFYETIRQGIGPGKAYGFGLLSLARPASEP